MLGSIAKFFEENPFYLLFALVNMWIVYKLIAELIFGNRDIDEDQDDDGDGGFELDVPILDLPPGVTLPHDHVELVST